MNFQFTLSEKEVNTVLAGLQELDVLRAQIQANYEEAAKPVEEEEMVHEMDHMFNGVKEGEEK